MVETVDVAITLNGMLLTLNCVRCDDYMQIVFYCGSSVLITFALNKVLSFDIGK